MRCTKCSKYEYHTGRPFDIEWPYVCYTCKTNESLVNALLNCKPVVSCKFRCVTNTDLDELYGEIMHG